MTEQVELEVRFRGRGGIPIGAPVRIGGRRVGEVVRGADVSAEDRFAGLPVVIRVDAKYAAMMGDGSGYGMPRVSFLLSRS